MVNIENTSGDETDMDSGARDQVNMKKN